MEENSNKIFKNNWIVKHEFKLFGIKIFETTKIGDESRYELPKKETLIVDGIKFVL